MKQQCADAGVLRALASFAPAEILQPTLLRDRLLQRQPRIAAYLLEQLPLTTKEEITRWSLATHNTESLKRLLAEGLNHILEIGPLHEAERFSEIDLRAVTRKQLPCRAVGIRLRQVNKLLLQDAFPDALESRPLTLFDERDIGGTWFRFYREPGFQRNGRPRVTFRICFKCHGKWISRSASSPDKALQRAKDLADEMESGAEPSNHQALQVQAAKAVRYDELLKLAGLEKLREVGVRAMTAKQRAEAEARRFEELKAQVVDAVGARKVISPQDPQESLTHYCERAELVLPKASKRLKLTTAHARHKAFYGQKKRREKRWKRVTVAGLQQFVREIPGCVRLAKTLEVQIEGELFMDAEIFWDKLAEFSSCEAPTPQREDAELRIDEITPLAIALWLARLGADWKYQRHMLGFVRHFFKFSRDGLHALAAHPSLTAADIVPMPVRLVRNGRISIIPVPGFHLLMSRLPDLDSVIGLAMRAYAGLHLAELLRLDIEEHIIWDGETPTQICMASGLGKETGESREPRHIPVRSPLDVLLKLRRKLGATGKLIVVNSSAGTKLTQLAKQLNIEWDESILRHGFASYLKGSGVPLKDVADDMGDTIGTVRRSYLRAMPLGEAKPFWELPCPLEHFEALPLYKASWDSNPSPADSTPLAPVAPNNEQVRDAPATSSEVSPHENINLKQAESPQAVAADSPSNMARKETEVSSSARNGVDPHPQDQAATTVPSAPAAASRSTAHKRQRRCRVQWPDNDKFFELLWKMPATHLAKHYCCSHASIIMRARALGIPTPGNGFWQRKNKGIPVEIPPAVQAKLDGLRNAA